MQPKVDNVHFKKDRKLQYDLIRLSHKIKETKHMTFGEKLFKLRKEKGLSQEALAEQVGTTRQAISKWENNQGFPETEKLLQLSNIFEISTDYLLKDEKSSNNTDERGYYVSKEMAIFVITGIVSFVLGAFSEQEQYKILKEEPLIFDYGYLKELSNEYRAKKKIYAVVYIPSIILFIIGIIAVSLTIKGQFVWSEYHSFVFFGFAIGLMGFCYCAGVIDAYELLIKNEQHTACLLFKMKRKIKDKINKL